MGCVILYVLLKVILCILYLKNWVYKFDSNTVVNKNNVFIIYVNQCKIFILNAKFGYRYPARNGYKNPDIWIIPKYYWVPQKLPQICTVIVYIGIGKVA